ncbi:velvet factor-domain-containing protein [Flammula alnicola]|nr:velvet factor-domain-containing protein [Flammula alnicola]
MYSQYHLNRQPQAAPYQPQAAPAPSSTHYSSQSSQSSSVPSSPTAPHSNRRGQARGADLIGRPVYFSTGPYNGKTIRMELHEIQKADLGRKYARVDRRPLDPPPVVHLKMFEVHNAGTDREVENEMTYDDVQVLGLLCTVDLFPVPGPDSSPVQPSRTKAASAPPTQTSFFSSPSPSSSSSAYSPQTVHYHHQQQPNGTPCMSPTKGSHFSGYILPSVGSADIVHHLDGFPVTEISKQTQALVGATFVQPAVIDYQGSKAIVFVFADLAVKIEGTFILRYRVFDIFARPYSQANDLAITGESYGGTFRVYSTKEFPGLSASTDLTKLLARWGVRLNIRETERRRRKRPASSSGGRSHTPE